jgi:large subunit ribosomal protein L7/L12
VTGLGLKESKEFLDALPKLLKKDVKRDEAVKLVAAFKALGADCSLE